MTWHGPEVKWIVVSNFLLCFWEERLFDVWGAVWVRKEVSEGSSQSGALPYPIPIPGNITTPPHTFENLSSLSSSFKTECTQGKTWKSFTPLAALFCFYETASFPLIKRMLVFFGELDG